MANSVEMRRKMDGIWERMKEINDRAGAEPLVGEPLANWEAAKTEMDALRDTIKRQEYLESQPAADEEHRAHLLRQDAQAGAPHSPEEAEARVKRAYGAAFRDYLRVGRSEMARDQVEVLETRGAVTDVPEEHRAVVMNFLRQHPEYRAQEIGNLTLGGFWVPDEMQQQIEKALLFYGGMRQSGAEVITTETGADLPWPVYDDTGNTGRRIAENAAFTETNVTVAIRIMKAYMYSSDETLVSWQFLQDVPVRAESWLADALGERVGRILNTEMTTYAGADGPQGIIRGSTLGVTAGAVGAITSDELHQLKYAVNKAYRNERAIYMMADGTYAPILRLKDAEGRYLFQPDPRGGEEPAIHGTRVVINNDMPALATGNITVEYGDFYHYKIRDVRGFSLLRLNEIRARNGQVVFLGFSRHDGAYINAGQNPIQHLIQA